MGREHGIVRWRRARSTNLTASVDPCRVCLPPLASIESIFSPSRLITWQEEDVNNVVVGGGREGERDRL